ncbi:BON domain-containing protein [Actinoplanes sp. G11-F43]|uniref:BON domain-containing protein n=1 Tax=Actinoplanes sp. G11-F43 TaxID=3424130 RepID=UPI003D348903
MWPQPFDDAWQDRAPRPAAAPDVQLTCQVNERILTDPRLTRERITVEVQNRVVNLIGTVGSLHARVTAAEVARSTPGVTDICNRLELSRVADVTATLPELRPDPFEELIAHWDDTPSPRRTPLLKGIAVLIATVAVLLCLALWPHLGGLGATLVAVPWLAVATALTVQSAL